MGGIVLQGGEKVQGADGMEEKGKGKREIRKAINFKFEISNESQPQWINQMRPA
jgi:hypothetical protein